jgi:hypothetical protein
MDEEMVGDMDSTASVEIGFPNLIYCFQVFIR